MDISKQQLVEMAQWLDDAVLTIKKWAHHAPDYFIRKGRLTPDIQRFEERAQAIRTLLAAAKEPPAPTPELPKEQE